MWLWIALMGSLGWAQDVEQKLTWSIRAGGSEIGHRDVTVKFVKTDAGVRRIIESWTELNGAVGPIPISMRQRMTVHAAGRDPRSFHSVMEFNGVPQAVQAGTAAPPQARSSGGGGRARPCVGASAGGVRRAVSPGQWRSRHPHWVSFMGSPTPSQSSCRLRL